MHSLHLHLASLAMDRRAVTALEYGLIAVLIGGILGAAAQTLGGGVTSVWSVINNTLAPYLGGGSPT